MPRRHVERHRSRLGGWLRAAVLGANDGIISTASLLLGVAVAGADRASILVAGMAGLVAGAMSMAAGEYVSVHSQADSERADLSREQAELERDPAAELRELSSIYVGRGVAPALAHEVAAQLMARDALGAHARDELGIPGHRQARPVEAAATSAASFAAGAALPIAVVLLAPAPDLVAWVTASTLLFLAVLGAAAAKAGGAAWGIAALRVAFWGALAMALTASVGLMFGKPV